MELKNLVPENIYNYKVVLTVYDNDASSALPATLQEYFAISKECARELYKDCVRCLKVIVRENPEVKCGYVHLMTLDNPQTLKWYDYNDNYDNEYHTHNPVPFARW